MEFVTEIPVRFADIDYAGIVYGPQVLHYYHCAFEDFFLASHGVKYWEWLERRRVGFPTVRVEAEYESPIRYGDTLTVAVTAPRVSQRSVDFRFEARIDSRRVGWSIDTKVCVDMDSLESRAIPDDLAKVLQEYSPEPQ